MNNLGQRYSIVNTFKRVSVSLILLVVISWGVWFMVPIVASQEPLNPPHPPLSAQSDGVWGVHVFVLPSSDGTDLFAETEKISTPCQEVGFFVDYVGGQQPTPFDEVNYIDGLYKGFLAGFFPADTNIQIADFEARCKVSSNLTLTTNQIRIRRFFVPANTEFPVVTGDNNGQLSFFNTSLNTNLYVIAMATKALPGALPTHVTLVGEPYSFRAAGATSQSDGNMEMSLLYSSLTLGHVNPLTLRIFEWDSGGEHWIEHAEPNINDIGQNISIATKNFGAYTLGSTPHWVDGFSTNLGLEASQMDNVERNLSNDGVLELGITSIPGSAISKPYTPTLSLEGWQSISYTALITPGNNTITVSVLALDYTELIPHVTPGQSLAAIDPLVHPSIRLKVDMSSSSGLSPRLLDWSLLAQVQAHQTYLPFILKH